MEKRVFAISRFDHNRDITPKESEVSLDELVALLTEHKPRVDKNGPLWSPVRYGETKHRRGANITAVSCLVFDFDTGISPDALTAAWGDYTYIIYSTFSSGPRKTKWRAVFPLAEDVLAKDWRAFYKQAVVVLGQGHPDPQCTDAARMFYTPSHPIGAEAHAFSEYHEGRLLSAADLPVPTPEDHFTAEKTQRAKLPQGVKGDFRTLNVVDFFTEIGLYRRCINPAERKHAVICPWHAEHTIDDLDPDTNEDLAPDKTDTVIWQGADGEWSSFHCSHNHCHGRKLIDVIRLYPQIADKHCREEWKTTGQRTNLPAIVDKVHKIIADDAATMADIYAMASDLAILDEHDTPALMGVKAKLRERFPTAYVENDFKRAIDSEIEKRKNRAAAQARRKAQDTEEDIPRDYTDRMNAMIMQRIHGTKLRYVGAYRKWLVWDGRRYRFDDDGEVVRAAMDVGKHLRRMSADLDTTELKRMDAHIRYSYSGKGIREMIALAQALPGVAVSPDELDSDPWLLNCLNGVIDLQTGALRPHNQDYLITKLVPVEYDPAATCPTWERFCADVFDGNTGVITFIQRLLGYCLTGDTSERIMAILWGVGKNGKTTLLEVIAEMLGDYAGTVRPEAFLVTRGDSIPNDIAALKGTRFVYTSESDEGRRLSEALVKQITGGDKISARFMRAEWFSYKPTFKVLMATNHRPQVRGTDNAIWDRLRLIPFTTRFDDNPVALSAGRCKPLDKRMREKLLDELPGILAWAVKGCLAWQQHGSLAAPAEVLAATEEYRSEMDTIQHFLNDWCVEEEGAEVQSSILYDRYRQWAQENGEREVMSNRSFSGKLAERGYTRARKRAGSVFIGLRVKTLDELEGAQDYPVDAPKPQNTESPGTQDPVGDEEIGTCICCGRPADRYTPVGEPICSACVEDDLSDMIITDDDGIDGEAE